MASFVLADEATAVLGFFVVIVSVFFVDVPAGLQVLVGVFVVVTIACVAMMLTPSRQPIPVSD